MITFMLQISIRYFNNLKHCIRSNRGTNQLSCDVVQVNESSLEGKTREEAVLLLLALQEQVNILVQYRPQRKSPPHGLSPS